MKKCPKCGLIYGDDMNFCTVCGEKLASENLCHQCGKKVPDGSNFCPNCGACVNESKKAQPTPSNEEHGEEVRQAAETNDSKVESREKALKIVNIIVASVSLLAALFFMIGIFGDIYRVYGNTMGYEEETINLNYFFNVMPNSINRIKELELQRSDYLVYSIFSFSFECFLYFGGMAACLVLMVFGIVKNIKAIVKKTAPNLSLLFAAGASMLPIILLYTAKINAEANITGYTLTTELGWGANLIISGLSILLVCSVLTNIFNSISKKKDLAPTIIRSIVGIAIFALLFNAFGPMTKVTINNGVYSMSFNGYAFAETGLAAYSFSSDSPYIYYSIFIDGFSSLLFSIAGLIVLFFAYKGTLKSKKASPIVLSALSVTFLIIASALSQVTTTLYVKTALGSDTLNYMTIGWGVSSIAGIVLILVLVLPGSIVANALSSKKSA